MADIQETLKESINEKTKSITVKDEFRKKGSKESDIDDNIWTLKKIKYSTFDDDSGKEKKHRYGIWKKEGAFGKGMRKFSEKMDSVVQDDSKFTQLLAGLGVISESSKMDREFKSPIGKVATGLTKGLVTGKQIGIANIAAKAKLKKAEQGPDTIDLGGKEWQEGYFEKRLTDFADRKVTHLEQMDFVNNRFTMLEGIKDQGVPTGLIASLLQPFEEILVTIFPKGSSQYEAYKELDPTKIRGLSLADKVKFKKEFQAATMRSVISLAKNLYPVSENDVKRLMEAAGSVQTYGEALKMLVSLQKAALERDDFFYQGINKYMAQQTDGPMDTITVDGISGNGIEDFAQKWSQAQLVEKYKNITQDDVDQVYGSNLKRDELSAYQLAAVANSLKLVNSNISSPELDTLDTAFRIQEDEKDLEDKVEDMNTALDEIIKEQNK